jgi:carboxymethylenebutenolidase
MRIELDDGTPAELAVPSGAPSRGLVLAPDIGGLRPLFDELCARLAREQGWAVCAPEPFAGREHESVELRLGSMGTYDRERYGAALLAAADRLEGLGAVPVGVLGFCLGGMFTLLAAGTGRFDRAVPFYGMIHVPDGWVGDAPLADPLREATSERACPVLAIIGADDPFTPADHVDELEAAGAEVVRYEGAGHGFVHDPSRDGHRAEQAADAWARAIAFLAT